MTGTLSRHQKLDREYRVWVLRTSEGWSEPRIAAELGISQPAVSQILTRVSARIQQALGDLVTRVKMEQNARLETIYAESMLAWEKSKAPKKSEKRKAHRVTPVPAQAQPGQAQPPPPAPGPVIVDEMETEEVQRDPSSSFLQTALQALGDQRKLWGLGEFEPASGDRDQPVQGTNATPVLPPMTRVILNVPAKSEPYQSE